MAAGVGGAERVAEHLVVVGRGHADRFWAVALACRKERGPLPGALPEIGVRVIG